MGLWGYPVPAGLFRQAFSGPRPLAPLAERNPPGALPEKQAPRSARSRRWVTGHDMIEKPLDIRMADGSTLAATVRFKESDRDCWLQLVAAGIDEAATGTDYFESFATIRRRLAKRNLLPQCYGASRNVWPSGMARDMGQGLAAYKLAMGRPAEERVHIFASGPDIDPVGPEEQHAFALAWSRSLK